jgi:DNA-binding GntR family transcriptional regulator
MNAEGYSLAGEPHEALTRVDYAVQRLRESILSGDLRAGERLHLDAIAQSLGMSAIPLREALRVLGGEGLVVPSPHRGYTVAPVTVADLDETYRMRLLLEPLAVKLAVPHLSESNHSFLAEQLDLFERAYRDENWADYRLHHRAFHFGIYDRSNAAWLLRFTDVLWLNTERYQRMTALIAGELEQRMLEHRQILAACIAGDGDRAASLMKDHLELAATNIRAFVVASEATPSPEPAPVSAASR